MACSEKWCAPKFPKIDGGIFSAKFAETLWIRSLPVVEGRVRFSLTRPSAGDSPGEAHG